MGKINYQDLSSKIVEYVGGVENINTITHCVTRLRLYLKDRQKANDDEIKKLPGVLGVVFGNGQYQIILGEHLFETFDYIVKNYKLETEEIVNENFDQDLMKKNKNFKYYFENVITFMAQSLTPFITVVYGAGMLKVFLSLISFFIPEISKGYTYQLFNFMATAPFYFMPVLVAYGTSKVLKSNPAFSMAISLTLLFPAFNELMSAGATVTMFKLPVYLVTYGNTLLPGIFIAIMCAYLEKIAYKITPAILRSVFAPLIVFLVGFPITVFILGPIGNIVGKWIVSLIVILQSNVGGFAPGVIAAIHPFLVMMGVNMLMVAPMMELLSRVGYDNVFRPGWILHNCAEGGACLAVAIRTKDKNLKATALSAGLGAIISGVSEPALYGINLRLKKPMIGLVIGGLCGGAVAGFMGAKAFSMGYSSILGAVIFADTMIAIIFGIITALVVSFVITLVLYNGESIDTK